MQSIFQGDYHYIRNGDGVEELYNWRRDPDEEQDLAGSEQGRSLVLSLRAAMRSGSARVQP